MNGYMAVDIPTKKYIKAYLMARFNGKVIMAPDNKFGSKLYDLLEHKTNEDRTRFSNARYNDKLRIFISMHTFRKRGFNLNETNIKNFNSFVEDDLKDKFYFLLDTYIEILPVYSAHVDEVRKKLGIDIEHWSDDSMKKDYYRYRKSMKLPLLYEKKSQYEKIFSATVPSEKPGISTF
jgi:hypothetical protein